MIALLESDTFWLILVNLVLGLVTSFFVAFLAVTVIRDLRLRSKIKRDKTLVPDDYLAGLKELGVTTLRDGGKMDRVEHQE
jgi:hypothetical protein